MKQLEEELQAARSSAASLQSVLANSEESSRSGSHALEAQLAAAKAEAADEVSGVSGSAQRGGFPHRERERERERERRAAVS